MRLVLFVFIAHALQKTSIPEYSIPPMRRGSSSAVYDELENRIITFGGKTMSLDQYYWDLYSYEFDENTWKEILPESYFVLPQLASSALFLRSDRILLVLYGNNHQDLSSEIYSYDLSINVWKTVALNGDYISARTQFTYTSFNYSNNEYIAIYGGITKNGVSDELFL